MAQASTTTGKVKLRHHGLEKPRGVITLILPDSVSFHPCLPHIHCRPTVPRIHGGRDSTARLRFRLPDSNKISQQASTEKG